MKNTFITKLKPNSMVEKTLNPDKVSLSVSNDLYKAFYHDAGKEVANFIAEIAPLRNQKKVLYYPEHGICDQEVDYSNIRTIVDLRQVNKVKDINKHFTAINKLLPDAGIFIGKFESYYNRKQRIYNIYGKKLGWFVWILDLILNRVFPKLKFTKELYKFLTRDKFKVISLAETLGRSVYCGFEIIDYKIIGNSTYFAVIKTSEPKEDKNPSYGPLFKMKRVGKDGNMIGVYKFRTMHPYSEYLQNFVVQLNGYDEAGKPKDDFRVTGWGKLFRKLWLDELPQLINVAKGEIGIVGVRPLSQFRFNQLPEDVRKERIKYTPGCIPPYVALNMPDALGNIEAERLYFIELKKHPFLTNLKYLFMGVFNIICGKIQSA